MCLPLYFQTSKICLYYQNITREVGNIASVAWAKSWQLTHSKINLCFYNKNNFNYSNSIFFIQAQKYTKRTIFKLAWLNVVHDEKTTFMFHFLFINHSYSDSLFNRQWLWYLRCFRVHNCSQHKMGLKEVSICCRGNLRLSFCFFHFQQTLTW